jgi:SHS2 domain-containing protein
MFHWVDHTAELELEIEARTEREVLEDALAALAELITVQGRPWERAERTVQVSAPDRPALLAAWLEELVFLGESQGFVATGIESLELSHNELTATVAGVIDDPPPLVKAVTYHRLLFEPAGDRYVARVVLDV